MGASPVTEMVIPVVDERAHVTKREVATDRVRVRTMVDTREELVSDTLQHEAIEVDRRAVERRGQVAQPEVEHALLEAARLDRTPDDPSCNAHRGEPAERSDHADVPLRVAISSLRADCIRARRASR